MPTPVLKFRRVRPGALAPAYMTAGAAGMDAIYDTLMSGTGDEPSTLYGLVARAVRISADKLTYRFLLRPEARFHDGSRLTAKDVAFSLNILKTNGHPTYRVLLQQVESAEAETDEIATIKLVKERSRDMHLIVAGMPILSEAFWKHRDFEAATLDPLLGAAARFTDEVVMHISCSDETLARLRNLASDQIVMNIVLVIGCYMSIARVIAVTEL